MLRIDPGESGRSASLIAVSATFPSRRCRSTPLLASARISRYTASASAPTRRATPPACREPSANSSAMLSFAATYRVCVVHLPFARSSSAILPGSGDHGGYRGGDHGGYGGGWWPWGSHEVVGSERRYARALRRVASRNRGRY
jgi:hypothetical protein